jgi:AAA+ ATPase superfamily predicted ATPase
MKIILALGLFASVQIALGQTDNCYEVIKEVRMTSVDLVIKKSKKDILFEVTDDLTGELQISNSGMPYTMDLNFSFVDGEGMPGIVGNILTINFSDGYTIDLTPRSKQQATGTAFFTLIHSNSKGGKQTLIEADKVFYQKLQTVDIVSFKYNVNQKNRDIAVSKTNAELIKRIVNCVKIE